MSHQFQAPVLVILEILSEEWDYKLRNFFHFSVPSPFLGLFLRGSGSGVGREEQPIMS
jgi:hypothetical protein